MSARAEKAIEADERKMAYLKLKCPSGLKKQVRLAKGKWLF